MYSLETLGDIWNHEYTAYGGLHQREAWKLSAQRELEEAWLDETEEVVVEDERDFSD